MTLHEQIARIGYAYRAGAADARLGRQPHARPYMDADLERAYMVAYQAATADRS
jgi:hypothetical protein